MKLYFYMVEEQLNGKPIMRFDECEVEETPHSYKPVGRFPTGYYNNYVLKSDVGIVIGTITKMVILEERDDNEAKALLTRYFNLRVNAKKMELSMLKNKLKLVEEWDCSYNQKLEWGDM